MELTTYFTDRQRFTLKSVWIPGIILFILGLIATFLYNVNGAFMWVTSQGTFTVAVVFTSIKLAIAYGWEHIITKDYKKALLTIAGFIILNFGVNWLADRGYGRLPAYIDGTFIEIIWSILQVIGVCFISGKRNFWQTGLVAGLIICYTTDFPFSPLSYVRLSPFNLQFALKDFFTPFLIYGWIFLAENYFSEKGYSNIINSKIQVVSGKEYRVLYPLVSISCWVVIYHSAVLLKAYAQNDYFRTGYSGFQSPAVLTNAVTFVMIVSIFYITATMTRNIVISRMNTIGNNNGWLYLLHFIPFANIIVWYKLYKAAPKHDSKSENGIFYQTKRDASINNYIIGIGVLFSILSLWMTYSGLFYITSAVSGILSFAIFVKLITYFILDKSKNAVVLHVVFGAAASLIQFIAAAGTGRPSLALFLAVVLHYFILIELFHPELEEADTAEIPASIIE
ncbi:hypothetical protein [Chitinophaga sp. LS1]|uniref:hypothetical protein n=1 Tax=Chitinophaga sp. LS1 TaxID=3051176 RepID=UPI002AAB038E|nr:hypothetical protein [Chitinophaga sp. LS1]WPV70274.1 hypothetical protein QQL36_16325 [Chitinophaga sp. LS1]